MGQEKRKLPHRALRADTGVGSKACETQRRNIRVQIWASSPKASWKRWQLSWILRAKQELTWGMRGEGAGALGARLGLGLSRIRTQWGWPGCGVPGGAQRSGWVPVQGKGATGPVRG